MKLINNPYKRHLFEDLNINNLNNKPQMSFLTIFNLKNNYQK